MKKLLFLPGYACTSDIWDNFKSQVIKNGFTDDYVDWPKEELSDFSNTYDFANWVDKQYDLKTYDVIIGHSMGGLVAIDLAKENLFKGERLILVESFLKSPSKFFQNLYLESAPKSLKEKIKRMLKEESTYYNQILSERLKNLDITNDIANLEAKVICIYGAREELNEKDVVEQLNLADDTLDEINTKVVSQCAHFPMLENEEEFIKKLIKELL